ncbi:DNA ligase [Denitromonas halophila]|uniref:DNA ligase n=1 Tax=Denitromonas halophila TaxID=1629404 RepID=A0A557QXW7_9RHOO|nr:DNA ligase [Denitromonas halophila]TVO57757.1 DNA ligase [Denitromonas halophila]
MQKTCVVLFLWLSQAVCAGGVALDPVVPPVVLAREATEDIDPAPYWVSEKLDGVRAIWDGRALRFRSGRPVHAPDWFVQALPAQAMDGELWLGRGRFAELSGLVRKQMPVDAEWRRVRYMIFELPDAPGDFSQRVSAMRALVASADVPWLGVVAQARVPNRAVLTAQLAEVLAAGGEGLMLHRADAPYLTGRSDALLKLKPWQDAEAIVTAHVPGQGRFVGMLGALEVRMADGRKFRIGTGLSDDERRAPPAIGAQISFRYRGLTATGLPRFASFWRVREPL